MEADDTDSVIYNSLICKKLNIDEQISDTFISKERYYSIYSFTIRL